MSRAATVAACCALALVTGACGGGDDEPAEGGGSGGGSSVIAMKDLQFAPRDFTAEVGQEVTWRNDDALPHNVVAQGADGPKSDTFGEGKTYAFTPKAAGTIEYVCTIHPGMAGTLTVAEASAS